MAQPAANTPSRVRLPAWGTEGKLDGTNYTLWRFKMKAILSAYELWDTVLGTDLKPVPMQDPNDPSIIFQPNPAEVQAWLRRDADALCQIVTSVKDSVLTLIQHVNTAAEAWTILKAQYETTNETRKQNLETQLANEKMSETESVEKFITRIKDLRDQMAAIGVSISSVELARKCIQILPPKFDSLATTLNTQVRVPLSPLKILALFCKRKNCAKRQGNNHKERMQRFLPIKRKVKLRTLEIHLLLQRIKRRRR